MKILVTGGTGLVGKVLVNELQNKGHEVAILTRSPKKNTKIPSFQWDIDKGYIDPEALAFAEGIIHLAGEGIADKRWTAEQKKKIIDSRVEPLRLLGTHLAANGIKPAVLVSASAIGYYGGERGDEKLTETSSPGTDFLAECTVKWENAASFLEASRTVHIRVGVVLSKEGGALPKLAAPVRWGVGAALGSGQQWMSWIHVQDLARLFVQAIEDENMRGAYNGVAPLPIRNTDLTKKVAKQLNRFVFLPPVPGFVLKVALGEMSVVVLGSAYVENQRINGELSFKYAYSTVEEALEEIYGKF
ncbi:MAG: TIGR01777 family oxidoreductase [Spirosomataceae bacterium]